eukprot:TRINITY_DN8156_c0_g2_i1.p1 TRINITY_DN8156_c0_g2~~TRINITY_DN8156_c0_g2_i1.p1  ORF type:complete len:161 (+),score=22.19 TRINITY_DN8156_c0_g2_i1:17-499(+)
MNSLRSRYDPTIEDSYRKQVTIDEEVVLLDILDTAGPEEFSVMRDNWLRQCQGFLLVFDITSLTSFDALDGYYQHLLKMKEAETVPLVIAGNKIDLLEQRKVPIAQTKQLSSTFCCPYYECSAKDRTNSDIIFYDVVREIRKAEPLHIMRHKPKRSCIMM